MKCIGKFLVVVLLACSPGYVSAQQAISTTTQSQKSQVEGEQATAVKGVSAAERMDYETKITDELASIQQRIAELRIEASNGPPQNKRILNLAANNLQMQKIAADDQLIALKEASEEKWRTQKAELEETMERLRKAL